MSADPVDRAVINHFRRSRRGGAWIKLYRAAVRAPLHDNAPISSTSTKRLVGYSRKKNIRHLGTIPAEIYWPLKRILGEKIHDPDAWKKFFRDCPEYRTDDP